MGFQWKLWSLTPAQGFGWEVFRLGSWPQSMQSWLNTCLAPLRWWFFRICMLEHCNSLQSCVRGSSPHFDSRLSCAFLAGPSLPTSPLPIALRLHAAHELQLYVGVLLPAAPAFSLKCTPPEESVGMQVYIYIFEKACRFLFTTPSLCCISSLRRP